MQSYVIRIDNVVIVDPKTRKNFQNVIVMFISWWPWIRPLLRACNSIGSMLVCLLETVNNIFES